MSLSQIQRHVVAHLSHLFDSFDVIEVGQVGNRIYGFLVGADWNTHYVAHVGIRAAINDTLLPRK